MRGAATTGPLIKAWRVGAASKDLQQMKAMNPKSAHEAMEEKDEDDFLSGDSPKPEHTP